ncbi:MAG: biotin/lipoyl-containing protein [Symbiobacteriia bacterium]
MKSLTSPMAGVVLRVVAQVGDSLTPGKEALVLESMKMEIPVEASDAGTVVEVRVKVGDFVNEGDVLIQFE